MSKQFSLLVAKLQDAIDKHPRARVNTQQCQVEAEIIGYLIGRKVAKNNSKYVPEDIDEYHTLPLRSLNRVATHAYIAFQQEQKKDKRLRPLAQILSKFRRK